MILFDNYTCEDHAIAASGPTEQFNTFQKGWISSICWIYMWKHAWALVLQHMHKLDPHSSWSSEGNVNQQWDWGWPDLLFPGFSTFSTFTPGSQLLSTRIKDAGIAIRHSRERILFYTAGSRNGLERVARGGYAHTKRSCTQEKDTFLWWKNMLRTSNRMKKTSRICWNR